MSDLVDDAALEDDMEDEGVESPGRGIHQAGAEDEDDGLPEDEEEAEDDSNGSISDSSEEEEDDEQNEYEDDGFLVDENAAEEEEEDGNGSDEDTVKKQRKKKKRKTTDLRLDDEDYDLLEENQVKVGPHDRLQHACNIHLHARPLHAMVMPDIYTDLSLSGSPPCSAKEAQAGRGQPASD